MPDHAAMFSSLHSLLVKDVTPHVVSLHSSKCQALKSAILNIALQLVPSLSSQVKWCICTMHKCSMITYLVTCVCVFVCLSVCAVFRLLTLKALTKKLCFWHTYTSSKYLGHGRVSRSSGQGQSQGHRSRKGQMGITKYICLQVVHLQLTRNSLGDEIPKRDIGMRYRL